MSEPRAELFAGEGPVVTYAPQDEIATIGLNRPAKRNAIHDGMLGALETAAAERACAPNADFFAAVTPDLVPARS